MYIQYSATGIVHVLIKFALLRYFADHRVKSIDTEVNNEKEKGTFLLIYLGRAGVNKQSHNLPTNTRHGQLLDLVHTCNGHCTCTYQFCIAMVLCGPQSEKHGY